MPGALGNLSCFYSSWQIRYHHIENTTFQNNVFGVPAIYELVMSLTIMERLENDQIFKNASSATTYNKFSEIYTRGHDQSEYIETFLVFSYNR